MLWEGLPSAPHQVSRSPCRLSPQLRSATRRTNETYKLQSTRPNLERRSFLKQTLMLAGMTSTSPALFAFMDEPATAELSISSRKLASMPKDYTGISFEEPQLYNPAYFSVANVTLVEAYKKLSSHGILRSGGHLSDVTRWKGLNGDFDSPRQQAGIEKGKTYWEWKLTDPSVRENKGGAIAIRQLEICRLRILRTSTSKRLSV